MDIKRLFYAVLRKSWIVILLAIIGGAGAAYTTLDQTDIYSAETTLYSVNQDKTSLGAAINYEDIYLGRQLVQDYSQIIRSSSVISAALSELRRYNLNSDSLRASVSVSYKENSNVIAVNAIWTDPKVAAAIANALSSALTEKVRELTNRDGLSILDKAKIPDYPLPTSNNKTILIGILAGIALGFGIIYVTELFNTTIRSAEDIEEGLDIRVLGIIPEHDIK